MVISMFIMTGVIAIVKIQKITTLIFEHAKTGHSCTSSRSREELKDNGSND